MQARVAAEADTQVLVRPAQPASTRVRPDEPDPGPLLPRASAVGAVVGAALAVCGVVLGISALLWAVPAPPDPREPAGIAAGEQDAGTASAVGGGTASAPSAAATPPPAATPTPTAAPAPTPAAIPTPAPPTLPPVTVLNNSRIGGLAARAAARFEAAGWPVAATGNYRGRLTATTVFHPPGLEAAARAFAARFPGVTRVQPRTATLPGSGLTVVLTRDFR